MSNDNPGRPTGAGASPDGRHGTWVPVNYVPELAHIHLGALAALLVAEGALVAACGYTEDPHTLDVLWPEEQPGSPQAVIDSVKGWSLTEIVHRTCAPNRPQTR
ncbi:hypothetical protein BKG82_27010 [Mycobacteroides chelonae]|uniref:Uncharacterized protein n=1 Tax=Mycobacteroides chelonae TaxID=1774 RepID=A0A1S1LL33_MYCCH|nr:hypothetical protein [Mycobacteroides chelonae]OHU47304.1 hypothetical protein BKG82_27010 [Mycobacteroides chelonae]